METWNGKLFSVFFPTFSFSHIAGPLLSVALCGTFAKPPLWEEPLLLPFQSPGSLLPGREGLIVVELVVGHPFHVAGLPTGAGG